MKRKSFEVLSLLLAIFIILSSVPMTSMAANVLCNIAHDWGDYVVTTAPTCSTKGVETGTCKRNGCGQTRTREVATDATKHMPVDMPKVEATCDRNGYEAGVVCGLCNVVISGYAKIPAKGHTSTALAAKTATCTEDGYTAGTKCKDCGTFLTGGAKIEKKGHDWTIYTQTAPDCKTGKVGKRTNICRNCSETEVKDIEPTHSFGAWATTKEATCTAAGEMTRRCTISGCNRADSIERVDIPKLGHQTETVAAKDATCLEAGITAGTRCKVCKEAVTGAVVIPAKGHTAVTVNGTPATCEASGTSDSSYCKDCGYIMSEAKVIAKLGHNMIKDTAKSKDATCAATGLYVEKCTNTGCSYSTSEVLAIIHEANWVTITPVTCTTDGKRRGTCTKCGMDVIETVKAEGHKVVNESKWQTSKAATCTEAGTKTAPCSVCGKTATKTIPALGHDEYINTARVEPTCTAVGKTESKKCKRCNVITVKVEDIAKIPHSFGEWVVKTTATCAAVGLEERKCTACTEKETKTVDRIPHTEEVIPAVAADCVKAGTTEGKKCTKCNTVTVATTEVPALGHTFVADTTASFAPTCELPGRDKGTCSVCNFEKDEEVKALGHTEVVIPLDPADCTNSGTTEGKECAVCKKVLVERQTIPALGHDMVVDTSKSTPATCIAAGSEFRQCKNCQVNETITLEMLPHAYGDWTVTKEAGCSESGEQTRICSQCNAIEKEVIPALGTHNTVINEGKDPTCTEPGLTVGTMCNICNTIFEAQVEIAALGHTYTDEPVLKPATTEAEGEYGYLCIVCNEGLNAEKIAKIDKETIKLAAKKYYYNGKVITPAVTVKDVDGNELVKGEDFDVVYSTGRKNPGKYEAQIIFKGNYEGEMTLPFTINPVKTAKVSYENKSDHILITWDKVVGATGYDVYIYQDSVNGTTRKLLKTLTGTSLKITKDYKGKALVLDENYRIGIVSRTKTEDGTVLKSKNPAFKTVTRKLVKPTLTVTTTTGKATLKWTNIANETGYEVVYAKTKDGTFKSLGTTKANVVTLTKSLTRGGTFYFKVRAYKVVDGETHYSNYSTIKSIKIK